MATKKTNKTKPIVSKKASVKPVASKKQPVRRSARVEVPVKEQHGCGCGHECQCCTHCGCGHRFISGCIKLIILIMVFFLGCVASPWFIKNHDRHMMPPVAFDDNGCVVLESVKCPKMLEILATADSNSDDCISHEEFKNALHDMRNLEMPEKIEEPADDD